jgi:flagellar basal-body rod modification protein FlgD
MITSGIDTTNSGLTESAALPKKVMDKDAFLNLLITQLQNQDPLNPTDGVEFTAQLAQFSSLEQLSNVNDNLVQLQNYQASINNSQAVSLIGKDISAKGNGLELKDDSPVACNFSLDANAAVATVSIYDSTGEFVRSFEAEGLAAGHNTLFWDGTDKDGNPAANGTYSFEVLAADTEGRSIEATTFFNGTVDKVTFENDQAYLVSGSEKFALGDVVQVGAPENAGEAEN